MQQIELDLNHHDFYCPATGDQIVGMTTPFEPSEATLFCYLENLKVFEYAEDWIKELYEGFMEETANNHPEAFKKLLDTIGNKYENTLCFSITTPGASFDDDNTVHFGIDMDYEHNYFLKESHSKLTKQDEPTAQKNYSRITEDEQLFTILDCNKKPLKTHLGASFPKLSENVSKNLLSDLNDIFSFNEESINLFSFINGGNEEELKRSFFYCVLSTMYTYNQEGLLPELEIENQIQWDRLFRFTPGPPHILNQLKATETAREYLGEHWVDLPLNYCSSLEQMKEDAVEFVPDATVAKIQSLVNEMSPAELIMVNILYNFFDYFSITLPILWVSGKINDHAFVASYWAFYHHEDFYELNENEYEYPRFLMNRLLHLKTLRYSYQWEDASLPK